MPTSNLIQFDEMPPDRHIELSRKGGIASGQSRRKKKSIHDFMKREILRNALKQELVDEVLEALMLVAAKRGVTESEVRKSGK